MATIVIMPNFVEAFCRRIPRGIHPSGQARIVESLYRMQGADSVQVLRLAARVCAIVARELRYLAENKETFGGPAAGHHLRHEADEWDRNAQTIDA